MRMTVLQGTLSTISGNNLDIKRSDIQSLTVKWMVNGATRQK